MLVCILNLAVLIACLVVHAEANCFCGYRRSGLLATLRCASDPAELPKSIFRPVLCTRMGDIVRIGDSSSMTAIREEIGVLGMTIEPYGLSQLQLGGRVVKLQLNLRLQAKLIDALAFAGLPDLKTLHAWRAPLALEGCSLAALPRLESLVLSCSSTFDRFIGFGPSFKSIRLIGCLGLPIQFICTQCTQLPEISVLRILPGPPSPGGIVTFESWWNSSQSPNPRSLVLGKCRPGVCSDDHVCRHNHALRLARSFRPHKPWRITTTPEILATATTSSSNYFLSIFLPILGLVLVLSIALCLFMSLRISRRLRGKRKLVGRESATRPEATAPPEVMFTLSVPSNRDIPTKS